MTDKQATLIQTGIRVLIPLFVWILFSRITIKAFFINPELRFLFILALGFAALLSQAIAKNKRPILIMTCDLLVGFMGLRLFIDHIPANNWLFVLDLILANLLILTTVVNEPHCQWIIYGVISGSGIVFLFDITYHHYFSLMALMSITLLIFANIFFSYPVFMKTGNRLSLVIIFALILALCGTLGLSVIRIGLAALVLSFYLFFEWQVNTKNYDKRNNMSLICLLAFSMIACL